VKKLGILPIIIILLIVAFGGYLLYQKSQVAPVATPATTASDTMVKKIDLSTQPVWVQQLGVTAKKGKSANGLDNVTVTVKGIATGVTGVTYVMQYQTTNKGTQGALSSKPIAITAGNFTKTIDLGTCSTKSCVRHDGVTSIDLELDFVTSSGDQPIWEKTLNIN